MAAIGSDSGSAAALKLYAGDTWTFPYTFTQADQVTPVDMTGSTVTATIYVGSSAVLVLQPLSDSSLNLSKGAFTFEVSADQSGSLPLGPWGFFGAFFARIAVVQVDASGNTTTLGVENFGIKKR